MKKILIAVFAFTAVCSSAQKKENWSVSFLVAPGFGGPQNSIEATMKEQHFDQIYRYDFFGIQGSIDYPKKERSGCYLVNVSLKKKGNGRFYFVAGISNAGKVTGFREGYADSSAGISYSNTFAGVRYRIIQFSGGYEISPKNSAVRFGLAPSIFAFKHFIDNGMEAGGKQTSIVPGASFQVRLPMGKEKKTFGLELIAEGNLAPKAKMKKLQEFSFNIPLEESKVNMMHATAGILLTFRG